MPFSIVSRQALRASTASTTTLRVISRPFSRYSVLQNDGPAFAFNRGPAPPRLPKEEQEIFEELQKQSTGAFSTPQRTPPKINQSPHSQSATEENQAAGKEETLHPDLRLGVKPEFEGEKNPKTGEVGGPKNEPLRWGAEGDWSYGGRVTDF